MALSKTPRTFRVKRRRAAPKGRLHWSARILVGMTTVTLLGFLGFSVMRHDRLMKYWEAEWISLPWHASWPPLPAPLGSLREDVARAVYAFAGARPEIQKHIPCVCGCRSLGHQSVHDCFVKHRSADGQVTEWEEHGLSCRVAVDITGDVMLWHEQGKPLSVIRRDIDREFSAKGHATMTPLPR